MDHVDLLELEAFFEEKVVEPLEAFWQGIQGEEAAKERIYRDELIAKFDTIVRDRFRINWSTDRELDAEEDFFVAAAEDVASLVTHDRGSNGRFMSKVEEVCTELVGTLIATNQELYQRLLEGTSLAAGWSEKDRQQKFDARLALIARQVAIDNDRPKLYAGNLVEGTVADSGGGG